MSGARRILLNASYRSIAEIGGKLASFVLYVVMARKLGASDFGVFSFCLTFVTLVTVPAAFGQDSLLTREVSRDPEKAGPYFANTIGLKLGLSLPILGLAVAGLALFSSRQTAIVSLLLGLGTVAQLLMNTCFGIFQAFERLGPVAIVTVLQRLLTAALGITLLYLGAGVVTVSTVFLISGLLGLILAVALVFTSFVRARFRIDLSSWKGLMWAALPIGLGAIGALILFRIDTVMLAIYKPATVVGNYSAAYRLLEATLFLGWAISAAVFPVLARLKRDSEPSIAFVFERALKLAVATALPLGVGAAVFAAPVIRMLYGPGYGSADTALRLLAPTIALYPLAYLANTVMIAQNRVASLGITYFLASLENILLNLVLIPRWSLNGAALGTSISQLLIAVVFITICLREFGRVDWLRITAGPLFATALAMAALASLAGTFAIALSAGAIVYFGSLIVFERFAYPSDARVLVQVLRRG
jgi:O-antigen/teichoic acid export membrane protein